MVHVANATAVCSNSPGSCSGAGACRTGHAGAALRAHRLHTPSLAEALGHGSTSASRPFLPRRSCSSPSLCRGEERVLDPGGACMHARQRPPRRAAPRLTPHLRGGVGLPLGHVQQVCQHNVLPAHGAVRLLLDDHRLDAPARGFAQTQEGVCDARGGSARECRGKAARLMGGGSAVLQQGGRGGGWV